ncbi:hypothetical protein BJ170DRAFT_719822 [Xylariales sp. AK1849]|nr:hypothetical protein BJ170DRAFT_719822 [Xylariales sp. AK1849]
MVGQLPQGSGGVAALGIIFAVLSATCSSLIVWLTWYHNERLSYVALIAYCTLLATIFSFAHEINVVASFHDIQLEQYAARLKNPDSPELRLTSGSTGTDLIIYYLESYCYNVGGLLVLFWAFELAQSVYGLTHKMSLKKLLRRINAAGKVVAVCLPILVVLLLKTTVGQYSQTTYAIITDVPLTLSLGLGSILMLAILGRYIYSRRRLLRFEPVYGVSSDPESQMQSITSSQSPMVEQARSHCKGIYDRWLMTRFSIAFALLMIYELTYTLYQQISIANFQERTSDPDFSAATARGIFLFAIPGNLPGIGVFLVFGTTTAFRNHMYITFVKRFQRDQEPAYEDSPSPSVESLPPLRAMGPDTMKTLPQRPGSANDWISDHELSPVEDAQVHNDRHTIYEPKRVSVPVATARPILTRVYTDSSKDSELSLVIMRHSESRDM